MVSATENRVVYECTGGTNYPFAFPVFDGNTDLRVVRTDAEGVESDLALGTEYTVEAAGGGWGNGGIVTTVETYTDGQLTIRRILEATQKVDFSSGESFSAEDYESAIDRLTVLVQQLQDARSRAITAPVSDDVGVDLELPTSTARANRHLAFNAEGEPITTVGTSAGPISSWGDTLVDDESATEALATLGLTVSDFSKTLIGSEDSSAVRSSLSVPHRRFGGGAILNTFRTASAANDYSYQSVCWARELGLFCAVGTNDHGTDAAMTSPDGLTWTARTTTYRALYSVCWSPELSLFCAVGYNSGKVLTSPDGIAWTARSLPASIYLDSVCWSPKLGIFCAVGTSGIMTSWDGITWTGRDFPVDTFIAIAVCWSPELELFCAISQGEPTYPALVSPDAKEWEGSDLTPGKSWYKVCWSPGLGLFCAINYDEDGYGVMTSPNGIDWTLRETPSVHLTDVCWSEELGVFCAVGLEGDALMITSRDGINWTPRTVSSGSDPNAICWSPDLGRFVIVSANAVDPAHSVVISEACT